jgi:dihydroorotase
MARFLLQQVSYLDPDKGIDRTADALVIDGQLVELADHLESWPQETEVIAAQGQVLAPGLVDLYSHSDEPGQEERETLLSLLQSAQTGGFVRMAILPDTVPAIDNGSTIAKIHQLYQSAQSQMEQAPQLEIWGALTQQGEQMAELQDLAASGVVGFGDGHPIGNWQLVRRLLEYLQPCGKPVMLWPFQKSLADGGLARQGNMALQLGLRGMPPESETAPLAALLEIAATLGTPVHIMRVSTARSVELIGAAQQRGVPVTASTTWMHLLGNTQTLATYDPHWRLEPPVGNEFDRQALVQAIAAGVLQGIAIDHRAHSYEDKKVAFGEAPVGAIGLQIALPLLWEQLVGSGQLTALQLWQGLSTGPARCLGGTTPSQLVLFNPQETWVANRESLRSRSSNTPWLDQPIPGRVRILW